MGAVLCTTGAENIEEVGTCSLSKADAGADPIGESGCCRTRIPLIPLDSQHICFVIEISWYLFGRGAWRRGVHMLWGVKIFSIEFLFCYLSYECNALLVVAARSQECVLQCNAACLAVTSAKPVVRASE